MSHCSNVTSKHFYIIASKILWKNAQKESGIEECYEELFLKYADNMLEIEDSIWDIAEERKIEIEPFFMQMDYRTWRRALESIEHWGSCEDWVNGIPESENGKVAKTFGMISLI